MADESIKSFVMRNRFLSNFYPAPVKINGILFPTVEHAYQASKTTDQSKQRWVSCLRSPGQAKTMGRTLVLRKDWEIVKVDIMLGLLGLKFEHSHLREMLLQTGDAYLVEGNRWHDNEWGDCYCKGCNSILGENKLGILLMLVREEIKKEVAGE